MTSLTDKRYPNQSEISVKGLLDQQEFKDRRRRTDTLQCFSKGDDQDYGVLPGELVFMKKDGGYDGGPLLRVFSSFNGQSYAGHTPESLMRQFTYVGVAQAAVEVGADFWGINHDDDPFAISAGGSTTLTNNGTSEICPGQLIQATIDFGEKPRSQGTQRSYTIDTGLNSRFSASRTGTPPSKALAKTEPFEASDFSVQLAGIYRAIQLSRNDGGISNIPLSEYFDKYTKAAPFTDLQEEALGIVIGIVTIASLVTGTDIVVNDKTTASDEKVKSLLDRVFGRNVVPGDNASVVDKLLQDGGGVSGLNPDSKDNWSKPSFWQDRGLFTMCEALGNVFKSKMDRVIGRAMSAASPGRNFELLNRIGKTL